ncbi:hypothetical protein QBC35DRAFT_221175 [Podospora australis]|uniref:Uncharacterized protein n=1 Tax=Podospora australis TaxID=1536484 RepID=A0AAN6WT66_9PEZI|nr:hypothetical protein QBC35DRAFT_221175 [Podospora australis]
MLTRMKKWLQSIVGASHTPRAPEAPAPSTLEPLVRYQVYHESQAHDALQQGMMIMGSGPSAVRLIHVVVLTTRDTPDAPELLSLLEQETEWNQCDVAPENDADFLCDGYHYRVSFWPSTHAHFAVSEFASTVRDDCFCIILPYSVDSEESWGEMKSNYEKVAAHRNDTTIPRFPVMVLAVGETPTPKTQQGMEFATKAACIFAQCSEETGNGLCNAFASLVEWVHAARMRLGGRSEPPPLTDDKTKAAVKALFP